MGAVEQILEWNSSGKQSAFARVVELEGFSAWAGDELVAINADGEVRGEILGPLGSERIGAAGARLLSGAGAGETLGGGETAGGQPMELTIEIHGKDVAANGLSCGGAAHLLLQRSAEVPSSFWDALGARRPVALVTDMTGKRPSVAVTPDVLDPDPSGPEAARSKGAALDQAVLDETQKLLRAGKSGNVRIGDLLVEAWVPQPRLVVVGSGNIYDAISQQAALLDWQVGRPVETAGAVKEQLDWGGASTALIVLTHDPHLDTPALVAGLEADIEYIGAMGSRKTQSKRLDRLTGAGVHPDALTRIHRPIGLDLGGRRPAEVAMSICAEILASRTGRTGNPLAKREGAIRG